MIKRARALVKANRPAEACAVYETWLTDHKDDVQTANALAMLYMRMQRFQEAGRLLVEAMNINPDYYLTRVNLAAVFYEASLMKDSLEQAEAAVRLAPEEPEARYARALGLAAMDRVDEAIKDLDVALAKKPNEPRYLEAKCKMLVFSHSWKDAETVCRALLRVEPSNAAGHYNLGLALVELQQREEAMREVERAVSLDPSNKEYRTKLENLRRRQAGNKASAPSATSPSTPKQP